jgi:hypothetical protein
MWCIYTIEFYSATMNKEFMSFARKWMELETIMLSYINQFQKDKNCIYSLICAI